MTPSDRSAFFLWEEEIVRRDAAAVQWARMRSGAYRAWEVAEGEFPVSGSSREKLRYLVRYGILAPSAHNTQPWAFSVSDNHIRVLLDDARALPASDPSRREMIISVGACVTNLLVAARHVGFRISLEEFPLGDARVAADLAFVPDESVRSEEDARLFPAISKRRSNRSAYGDRGVPADVLMKLRAYASSGDPRIDLVEDRGKIGALAEVTGAATVKSMADPAFRRELSRWVRNNFTRRPDGMPGFTVGVPDIPSLVAPLAVRLPPVARAEANTRREQVSSSPVVGVIGTRGDDKRDWLRAGMLLEQVWLAATAEGLAMVPLAALVEIAEFFKDVQRIVGTTFRPQAVFRLGFGSGEPHPTPRRALDDVLASGTSS